MLVVRPTGAAPPPAFRVGGGMAGYGPRARLCEHYEVEERGLLGNGTHGPVLRARDVRSGELVAIKVFDAAEAFHSGSLPRVASVDEAHELTFRRFAGEVEILIRIHGPVAGWRHMQH